MTDQEKREEIAQAIDMYRSLPQAHHISEERAIEYIQAVLDMNESPVWHIGRMGRIGPSEAGSLVATYMNINRGPGDAFINSLHDARDVVRRKLFKVLPEEIPATKRGKRLEFVARKFFIEDLEAQGYKVEVAHEELEALKAAKLVRDKTLDPDHPWLPVPSIDDLLWVTPPGATDRQLLLPDYKCPSADMHAALVQDVGVTYRTQLHLYKYGLAKLGIPVDKMCLAPFNYEDATVPMIPVDHDADFEALVLQCCDIYYEQIELGQIPPRVGTAQEIYDPGNVPEDAKSNAYVYATTSALIDQLTELKSLARDALEKTFENVMTTKQVMVSLGPTNVSLKPVYKYDTEAMMEVADAFGIEIGAKDTEAKIFSKIQKAVSAGEAHAHLDNLREVVHTKNVRSASGNKPGAHLMKSLKSDASQMIEGPITALVGELADVQDIMDKNAMDEKARLEYITGRNERLLSDIHDNRHLITKPTLAPGPDEAKREVQRVTVDEAVTVQIDQADDIDFSPDFPDLIEEELSPVRQPTESNNVEDSDEIANSHDILGGYRL